MTSMGIKIEELSMPENCFRCFASHWYDFGGKIVGFRCGALPKSNKIISNCEGRTKRRDDCPFVRMDGDMEL